MQHHRALMLSLITAATLALAACGGATQPSPGNPNGFGGKPMRVTSNTLNASAGQRDEASAYLKVVNTNDHTMRVYVGDQLEAIIAPGSYALINAGAAGGTVNVVAQDIYNPGTTFSATVDPAGSILMIP